MHSYLRSIGFSELERKELDQILKEVITQYDEKTVIENSEGHLFVEVSKIFGCDVGITVCGEYDENNEFEMEYYRRIFEAGEGRVDVLPRNWNYDTGKCVN